MRERRQVTILHQEHVHERAVVRDERYPAPAARRSGGLLAGDLPTPVLAAIGLDVITFAYRTNAGTGPAGEQRRHSKAPVSGDEEPL